MPYSKELDQHELKNKLKEKVSHTRIRIICYHLYKILNTQNKNVDYYESHIHKETVMETCVEIREWKRD